MNDNESNKWQEILCELQKRFQTLDPVAKAIRNKAGKSDKGSLSEILLGHIADVASATIIGRIMAAMERENDRGCVIAASALLESTLDILLEKAFRSPKMNIKGVIIRTDEKLEKEIQKALNNESIAALCGDFASKTQLAYLLGLISDEMLNALNRIRKIRNAFAHSPFVDSLSDQNINGLLNILQKQVRDIVQTKKWKPAKGCKKFSADRNKFIGIVMVLWVLLACIKGYFETV